MILENVQDHGGDGSLPVRSSDHHAGLILCVLIQKLGVGIDLETELLGSSQFGIVCLRMHSKDDGVEFCVDLIGEPSLFFRKQFFVPQA